MIERKKELEKQLREELEKDEFSINEQKLRALLLELAEYSPGEQGNTKEAVGRIWESLQIAIGKENCLMDDGSSIS